VKRLLPLLVLAGCARSLPPDRPTANLYRDLERLVTVAGTAGWGVDRLEVEGLLAASLDSVCRVDPLRRRELLAWIDVQIEKNGGPVDDAWRRRGKRLGRVKTLLTLTRIRLVLAHADQHADADCPFWLEPDEGFAGRQISDDRWTLSGGGGGKAMSVAQGDQVDLNFGGAGRLLIGRTFGSHALYTGLEAGASASFPKDETGMRVGLVLGVDVVLPLVYRRTFVNSYVELEGGLLGHATEEDPSTVDKGMHVGAAFGGRATRTRFFFPGAAFGVSYERTFPEDDEALHVIKVGLRVAFDVDL
jgi:hypothetical protein